MESSSSSRYLPGGLSPVSQAGTCTLPPRQRSEPCLAVHNLDRLNRAYEEGVRDSRSLQGEGESGGKEDEEREDETHFPQHRMEVRAGRVVHRDNRYGGESYSDYHEDRFPGVSQSLLCLTEVSSSQAAQSRLAPDRLPTHGGPTSDRTQKSSVEKLPLCLSPRWNTLPSLMVVPPPVHLPPLVNQSDSHLQVPAQVSFSKGSSLVFQPHPPRSSPSPSSSRASVRAALLPRLALASSVTSLVAPPPSRCRERGGRSLRRHSVQLDQIRGGGEEMDLLGL